MIAALCLKCGNVEKFVSPKALTLICQRCGNSKVVLKTNHLDLKLKCANCEQVFSIENDSTFNAIHTCNKRESSKVFLVTDELGIELDVNEEVALIERKRGLGDVLMTTSFIKHIQDKFPRNVIWYACDNDVAPVLEFNPRIDKIIPVGKVPRIKDKVSRHIMLTNVVEDYKENKEKNKKDRIDLFYEYAGVRMVESPKMEYYLQPEEDKWAKKVFKSKKKILGFGIQSYAPFRQWPKENWVKLINKLRDEYEIVLFGDRPDPILGTGIINSASLVSVRQLGALINQCSIVISGDTSIYHFAEALGVKNIPLFGSIPPEARIKYYEHSYPLFGRVSCSPCWDKQFVEGKDSVDCMSKGAKCMRAITVSKVIDRIEEALPQ